MKIFQSMKKNIGIVIPMVLLSFFSKAQTYTDFVTSCTSKDLLIQDAEVSGGDACNECANGFPITRNLTLYINNRTSSYRANFKFWATLVIIDPTSKTPNREIPISGCQGPINPNSINKIDFGPLEPFMCGSKLLLKDIILAWTDASKLSRNECDNINLSNISPKCGVLPEILVRSGMVVFENVSQGTCSNGKPTDAAIDLKVEGGTPGPVVDYRYAWTASNGGEIPAGQKSLQDLSGLKKSGRYSVTITDANNCTKNLFWDISIKKSPTVSANPIQSNCNSGGKPSDGAINLNVSGGTGTNFTYQWSAPDGIVPTGKGNGQNLMGIQKSGTYSVTVMDEFGCVGSTTATITVLQVPSIASSNMIQSSCRGNGRPSDGAIEIEIAGGVPGYTYSWTSSDGEVPSGQVGNQNLNAIKKSGTYAVAITDARGCMHTASYAMNILRSPVFSTVNVVHSSCASGKPTLGAIELGVSSGKPGYSYAWAAVNGGAIPGGQGNNQNLSGIENSGTYSVTVTDELGCVESTSAMVTILKVPGIASSNVRQSSCRGNGRPSDGAIEIE
ncbi:MAG: SprB repeat-containing protein, partial [Chitinophagaceae bacterium]